MKAPIPAPSGAKPKVRIPGGYPGSRGYISTRAFVPAALLFSYLLTACLPQVVSEAFSPRDLRPPSVRDWDSTGPGEFSVQFDEEVEASAADFASDPDLGEMEISSEGNRIRIAAASPLPPGSALSLEGTVRDGAGNSTSFVLPFWGYNPSLPVVLLNEVLTQGSTTHPDLVELAVLESGNLAGLTFRVGCAAEPVQTYVFPPCEVAAGDFVVLHLKPQSLPEEMDETGDAAASGGLDAYPYARDFWYPGGDGALPGENGCLTLNGSPTGRILDALLYSARTSASDTKYGGFGSQALLDQARALAAEGAWRIAGSEVRPEDAARSEGTTSTRTICRSSDSGDTDSGSDWHVVPTKGSTVGRTNSDALYVP